MNREKVHKIIHNTIYTGVYYPHIGNNNILAANWILNNVGIRDIDMICKLAKVIDEYSTYDHEISEEDLDSIMKFLYDLLKRKYEYTK